MNLLGRAGGDVDNGRAMTIYTIPPPTKVLLKYRFRFQIRRDLQEFLTEKYSANSVTDLFIFLFNVELIY